MSYIDVYTLFAKITFVFFILALEGSLNSLEKGNFFITQSVVVLCIQERSCSRLLDEKLSTRQAVRSRNCSASDIKYRGTPVIY